VNSSSGWQTFREIYLKFLDKAGTKGNLVFPNTVVNILRNLGAEYKHTETGGAWLFKTDTELSSSTSPDTNVAPDVPAPSTTELFPLSPTTAIIVGHSLISQTGVIGVSCPGAFQTLNERRSKVKELLADRYSYSQEQVGETLGVSQMTISCDLRTVGAVIDNIGTRRIR
jgi:hypothetical protein